MRYKPQRSHFMPRGKYETIERPGVDAVCYTYDEAGVPYGMGFNGKQNRPAFHNRFGSPEARIRAVEEFLDRRAQHVDYKAKNKKNNKGHQSRWAQGAASIRVELAKAFPGIKFSVTSEGYSQGSSIDVNWDFGPTESQIEPIIEKYQYDRDHNDAARSAFRDANGSARFVKASRHFPHVVWVGICKAIATLKGVEYTDIHQSFDVGPEGYMSLTTYAHRTLNRVAFPPGVTELTCAIDLVIDWSEEYKRDGNALIGDEFQVIYPGAVMIPRDQPQQTVAPGSFTELVKDWTPERIQEVILEQLREEAKVFYHPRSPVGVQAIELAKAGQVEIHDGENGLNYITIPELDRTLEDLQAVADWQTTELTEAEADELCDQAEAGNIEAASAVVDRANERNYGGLRLVSTAVN